MNGFHQMPLDESKDGMISFIYMRKAFFVLPYSDMTDGSGTTHRKYRGAKVFHADRLGALSTSVRLFI